MMNLHPAGCVIAALIVSPLNGQWINYPTPGIPRTPDGQPNLSAPAPRTPDGRPDFSGLWRPARGGKYALNVAVDLKPEEIQPWARAQARRELEAQADSADCLPIGPRLSGVVLAFKILQTPGLVAFLYETATGNAFQQVFLDGRGLPKDPNPSWYGYSIGRWDGDTLVVETAGFNNKTVLDGFQHPHTEALHITDRFRRRDFGHIELQRTFADPGAYARPWTITVDMEFAADDELLEYICLENERDAVHRTPHMTHMAVPPAVLARYAGKYQPTSGGQITVTLEDGQLMVEQDPRGPMPLFAHSQTSFLLELNAFGPNTVEFEFVPDEKGAVSQLIRRPASGAPATATRVGTESR
jgi:hypothetical protein